MDLLQAPVCRCCSTDTMRHGLLMPTEHLSGCWHNALNGFKGCLWRRQHACIACGRPGEFILRLQIDSHLVHLICRRWDPPDTCSLSQALAHFKRAKLACCSRGAWLHPPHHVRVCVEAGAQMSSGCSGAWCGTICLLIWWASVARSCSRRRTWASGEPPRALRS